MLVPSPPPSMEGPWSQVSTVRLTPVGFPIRDNQGNFKLFNSLIDQRTGEIYNGDDPCVIRIKCALILTALSFYTVGNIVWRSVQLPLDVTRVALGAIDHLVKDIQQSRASASTFTREFFFDSSKKAAEDVWEVLRVPFLAIAVAATASLGLISPYEGRKYEAKVERIWQHGAARSEDVRRVHHPSSTSCLEGFFRTMEKANAFYLAYCFQPVGCLDDKKIAIHSYGWKKP